MAMLLQVLHIMVLILYMTHREEIMKDKLGLGIADKMACDQMGTTAMMVITRIMQTVLMRVTNTMIKMMIILISWDTGGRRSMMKVVAMIYCLKVIVPCIVMKEAMKVMRTI